MLIPRIQDHLRAAVCKLNTTFVARGLTAALGLACLVNTASAALVFGPGAGLGGATAFDTPNQERLNVDRTVSFKLLPGTYSVLDFSLNVANPNDGTGTVTPMLLSGTPSNYTTLWVGTAFDPSVAGVQTAASFAPGAQTFTVSTITNVFGGIFTGNNGSEIPAINLSTGVTDHDTAFVAPSGVGQSVTAFSNAPITRSYAFGINTNVVANNIAPNVTVSNGNLASVSTDLLQTNLASVVATGIGGTVGALDLSPTALEPLLRNGTATNASGYLTGSTTATGGVNGAVITYTLDTALNSSGYRIDQVDIFHGWRDDGRDDITSFNLAYSTVLAPGVFIDVVVGGGSGDYAADFGRTSVVPGLGSTFVADNVAALRFTFNGFQNGSGGLSEIDVIGRASPVPEPASMGLMLLSIGGLAMRSRRQRV